MNISNTQIDHQNIDAYFSPLAHLIHSMHFKNTKKDINKDVYISPAKYGGVCHRIDQ